MAIAMELNDGLIPFISQKALKHVLVGVEKLVKAHEEQQKMVEEGHPNSSIIDMINKERVKCGLEPKDSFITDQEIIQKDSDISAIVNDDSKRIFVYIETEGLNLQ